MVRRLAAAMTSNQISAAIHGHLVHVCDRQALTDQPHHAKVTDGIPWRGAAVLEEHDTSTGLGGMMGTPSRGTCRRRLRRRVCAGG
jgi:hypothetical protein